MPYPDNFNQAVFDSEFPDLNEADNYMTDMQCVWCDLLNYFSKVCIENKLKVSLDDVELFAESVTDVLRNIADKERDIDLRDTTEDVHPYNHEMKVAGAFSDIITLKKCAITKQVNDASKVASEDFYQAVNQLTATQVGLI